MNILLADDHTLFRDILEKYLDRLNKGYKVELAKDLFEAFDIIEQNPKGRFDLVILDLCMPGMNGFEGLKDFIKRWPETPVTIISGVAQQWEVMQAIEIGAVGFFPKSMSGIALAHAIELVLVGEKFVPVQYNAPPIHNPMPPMQSRMNYSFSDQPQKNLHMTKREKDVLVYLTQGASNQFIAEKLGIKSVTVKLHVRNLCRKLGAQNRTQAALIAQQLKLI